MSADLLLLGGALLSGLLGSAHCALMCGGIATGFSATRGGTRTATWLAALEPNLGRILGYALAGAIAGGLGHGIVAAARLPSLALAARAAAGVVLIIAALRLFDRKGQLGFLRAPGFIWNRWLSPLQKRLPAGGHTGRIAGGMLWGWLPCGLSATVLMAAWLQSSALHGALLMLAFGAGTLPAMVPLTWSGARLGQRLQQGPARMALATVILVAGLVTVLAPWLARVPHLHVALRALGCRSIS
ncbi:MAG TPA: sulfite exporter TauE/SafE family protein [Steroidobacteraceae bacterium]|nr:sulfite exporter TauE/SafE family protein [Steroidobacteraceae bacterium]